MADDVAPLESTALPVEADVLQRRAGGLQDADLQHHLLEPRDPQRRGHAVGGEACRRWPWRAVGDAGGGDVAGQQHAVAEGLDLDVLAGQGLGEVAAAGRRRRSRRARRSPASAGRPGRRPAGWSTPSVDAADIEAAVGGGDHLGDVGLGDDDLAGRLVQAEGQRLVLRHRDGAAGRGFAGAGRRRRPAPRRRAARQQADGGAERAGQVA